MFWLGLLILPVHSAVPMDTFPRCGEEGDPELCPEDLDGEWFLISTIPEGSQETVREAERSLGSGNWADRAWRTTAGQWDAIISVCDSGIDWSSSHVRNKVYLNIGELPLPQDAEGVTAADHDLDGNGLVNIQDYAEDPRVSIEAGSPDSTEELDASDLIAAFSDGVDDDGNGYADDISGWDFFEGDNDAWSRWTDGNYGRHGTGVMKEAAAEGDDGGDIGVCPNCAVLPCRVGDSFIVDGARVAQGVAFSVDSGASAISLAVGALTHPPLARQALDYAEREGVVVIGVAGDENSYHRNFPSVEDEVVFVHSIRHDNADAESGTYSYFNTLNCNNYGPRMDIVAASEACATGSAAILSGTVGMLQSAAMERGFRVEAGVARQLLSSTADDIWLTEEEREISEAYPSREGWDPFYGHGRVNVARAVEAVAAGELPPQLALEGVHWFEYLDPTVSPTRGLVLSGESPLGEDLRWELSWSMGWDEESWTLIAEGEGAGSFQQDLDWSLAEIPLKEVGRPDVEEGVMERVRRTHAPMVTLKLDAWDAAGREAVLRRSVLVHHDPYRLEGFPQSFESSIEASPILEDLDGDAVLEIILADSGGTVHVLRGDGSPLTGWPVSTSPSLRLADYQDAPAFQSALDPLAPEGVLASPAAADLDGDGWPEVVVAGIEGRVYAWSAAGELLDGFPLETIGREPEEMGNDFLYDTGVYGAPTLVDLDGDEDLEIVVSSMDGRLYAWHHDGGSLEGYPLDICHPEQCEDYGGRSISSPMVADVDGDGRVDIGVGSNVMLDGDRASLSFLYDGLSGELKPGWPKAGTGLIAEAALLPVIAWGHPASLGAAEVTQAGQLDLLDQVMLGQEGLTSPAGEESLEMGFAADTYGEEPGTNEPSLVIMTTNPAFGDLNLDGVPDPVMGGAGAYALVSMAATFEMDFQHAIGAWDGSTGGMLHGWPQQVEDFQFFHAPAIADVNSDSLPEVIYGSGGGVLYAWDFMGRQPEGWPHFTGQWILGSPAVGDITGDGWLDVVVVTREGGLFAWTTAGPADQDVQWASIHHDPANSGSYHHPLPAQAGPKNESATASGCCGRKGNGTQAWWLLPMGLWSLRRRELSSR